MADKFAAKRVEEAHAELKKANKALKTSLFKWSADYDAAARHFEAAASRYSMANMLQDAKSAFLQSAESKLKSEHASPYFAAKHYESAAGCAQREAEQELDSDAKLQLVDESAALMLEAAAQFQASGHMDRCIDCYSKSAKFCHDHRADRALMTYNKMAQMCNNVSLDMVAMLIDFVRDAIGYVCGQRSFDVAIELLALHKKWALHLGQVRALNQVLTATVVVYLVAGQGQLAMQSLEEALEVGEYAESNECEELQALIGAISRKDANELKECQEKSIRLRGLDRGVYQLAMSITVDSATVPRMAGDSYEEFVDDSLDPSCPGGVDLNTALEHPRARQPREVDLDTAMNNTTIAAQEPDEDELC